MDRSQNAWADWLSKEALRRQEDNQVHSEGEIVSGLGIGTDLNAFTAEGNSVPSNCKICKLVVKENAVECWGCDRLYHRRCIAWRETLPQRGPWHCKSCTAYHRKRCTRDVTLDKELLKYVINDELPESMAAKARVARSGKYVVVD